MPLVKGTRSKIFTSSSQPRPPYITEVEKLQDALERSEQEVLKMREQMEFLAFLVKRAWQGDRTAMSDVASIVGCETSSVHDNLLTYTGGDESCDGDKWAHMVERMLWLERQRDVQQSSTVKLAERECMLEGQLETHTPVFSSYLNKPRGNFKQKVRAKSAAPVRQVPQIKSRSNLMTKPPSGPSPSPRPTSPSTRPRSAPAHKKYLNNSTVSVHGSEVFIAHSNNNNKETRTRKNTSQLHQSYYLQKRLGIPDEAIVLQMPQRT